jgi:hypothetical protein
MKALALSALLLVSSVALAQDKVLIQPKWEKGQKHSLKFEILFDIGGMTAKMTGTAVHEAKSVSTEGTEASMALEGAKLDVGGDDPGIAINGYTLKYDEKGQLKSASGGVEGSDSVRTFLLTQCYLPQEAVAKDGTWKQVLPESKTLEIGERAVEGTYLGTEAIGGKDYHKFKVKVVEKGNSFTTDGTYWVDTLGQVQKLDVSYMNLPVPAVGGNANGTAKASAG